MRVIRTARVLGVKTLAVYSTADARSTHASFDGRRGLVCSPPVSGKIYLDVDKVTLRVVNGRWHGMESGGGLSLLNRGGLCLRVDHLVTEMISGDGHSEPFRHLFLD